METKEVLNITPDDWAISDSARGLDINGGLKTAGQPTGLNKVCIMNKGGLTPVSGNPKHNALAIVTAVNNTYKKGIDPSAVPEMLEALKEASSKFSELVNSVGYSNMGGLPMVMDAYIKCQNAIKKASITI